MPAPAGSPFNCARRNDGTRDRHRGSRDVEGILRALGAMIRLLPLTSAVVRAVEDPDAFSALTGAMLGDCATLAQKIVAQDVAHRARTGPTPGWGGFLVVDEATQRVVGACGFVSAPDADGAVEIGYGPFP